mmetsp:Transcript_24372/g.41285  ORF Transcript_24372/g.41285 Transcript_24372/m.41285 type:complete len:265 (+) Transcript_24372:68-862(+)
MVRGYLILFDQDKNKAQEQGSGEQERGTGHALLQKKSYFQNFSIERNSFNKEPVCGNPGQYTLPGGRMSTSIVYEHGTLAATLKQFNEESGISHERLALLNCVDHGYYAPSARACEGRRSRGPPFFVHFLEVDDVKVVADEANASLHSARLITGAGVNSLTQAEKESALRQLYEETGLNDDAADRYEVMQWSDMLDSLETCLGFDVGSQEEWARLVREQGLFFNTEGGQEDKIQSVLDNPGSNRDWLIDGVKCFLYTDNEGRKA